MNRISRLLHKMNFLARQRRAVKYSHKYVISKRAATEKRNKASFSDDDDSNAAAKVLDGFDPINNEVDRRMLFEVTGMRLRNSEFQDDSSSDSAANDDDDEVLLIDYAFMERFDDIEDDTGQNSNLTYTLNP